MMSVIRNRMRMYGYKKDKWIADSINELASKKTYHPIRDYLGSLVWDGQDHIGKLSIYFKDKKNVFHFYFRKWVVGAVARAYAGDQGCQNAMLVLDGKQNLGKSFFASWLCSPLPAYFIESPVFPDDKDYKIRCVSSWIWEVYELGSTTRKADREALKGFITAPTVTVRKPYGHCDIKKPATTNFIGTLNNEGGFLNDPTGSRRFLVSTLEEIDWRYSKEVDVNQLWAQAVALYRSGEKWELNGKERETQEEINEEYRVYNPLIDCIRRAFIIDPHKGYFTPSSEIMETLYKNNYIQRMDKSESMKVAEALIELGCVQERRRVGGALVRGWSGLQAKDNVSVGDRYGLIDEDRSYN